MVLNFALGYASYLLGMALFVLNIIGEYKKIAEENPNPDVCFNGKIFWRKESVNLIKMLLWGIASMVLMIPLSGISIEFHNAEGAKMFESSVKVLMFPIYFILGYSGGKLTERVAGKYRKELTNKFDL